MAYGHAIEVNVNPHRTPLRGYAELTLTLDALGEATAEYRYGCCAARQG